MIHWSAAAIVAIASASAGEKSVRVRVLDSNGQPLAGAVVFVAERAQGWAAGEASAAPGAAATQAAPLVMDQVDAEFVPRVLAVPVGSSVRFPNRDRIRHHVYSFSKAKPFDLDLYEGEPSAPVVFDKPGLVKLGCNIHDWMVGYILVTPTPAFAVTDAAGRASVPVPDRSAKLAVFHERARIMIDETALGVPLLGELVWRLPTRRFQASKGKYGTY